MERLSQLLTLTLTISPPHARTAEHVLVAFKNESDF